MKKKSSGITKATVVAVLAAGIIVPTTVSAAPYDVWNGTTKVGNLKDAILDDNKVLLLEVLDNAEKYRYELNKKTYLFSEADAIASANPELVGTDLETKIATDLVNNAQDAIEQTTSVSGVYTGGLMSYVDVAMNQFTSNIDKVYVDGVELSKTQYSLINNGSTLRIVQVTKASQVQVKLVGQNDKIQVVF